MVVCSYFLQGTCRFGQNCRYDHIYNDSQRNYQNEQESKVDTSVLIKAVSVDMQTWEKSGQWVLSCYGPFKEKPCFPSFEDYSFEEIRCGIYDANKNGNVDEFKRNYIQMKQSTLQKIRALQHPSPDAVKVLEDLYNRPAANSNVFGTYQTDASKNFSFAAASQQQNNVFTKPSGFGTSIFGGNSSTYGSAQNTFKSPLQQQSQSQSVFGSQTQSIFSNNQQLTTGIAPQQTAPLNQSIFAQPSQNVAQNQVFGTGALASSNQSVFGTGSQQPASGSNQSIFGGTSSDTNQSLFGQPNQQSMPSTFGQQPQQSIFTNPIQNVLNTNSVQATQSTFSFVNAQSQLPQQPQPIASNSNIFSQTAIQNPSVFGSQQVHSVASQNIFGGAQNVASSPFTNQFTSNSSSSMSVFTSNSTTVCQNKMKYFENEPNVYSKLEELSEDDVKAFQDEKFYFGKIPEKPPTLELCI